jgi:hypothetical protein
VASGNAVGRFGDGDNTPPVAGTMVSQAAKCGYESLHWPRQPTRALRISVISALFPTGLYTFPMSAPPDVGHGSPRLDSP